MSGVDQLFDRFGDLLKSWTRSDGSSGDPYPGSDRDSSGSRSGSHTGDPILDEAMQELDAFLDDDREAQERLRKQREARAQAEERARSAGRKPSGAAASGPPPKLIAAYRTLGLQYGATFDQAKASYKKLLKEHHPDKHASTPDGLKKATETSARINDAFRIIETWNATGTMGDE